MTGPHTVAVIGVGAMGRPIAERVASAGFTVLGFDTAAGATAHGVRVVPTLAEAAAADTALVVVPTDADVTAVVAGPGGLIASGHPGLVIAVCSSVLPDTCRSLARLARDAGMDLLDVALTGGLRGARSGQLNLLVGGAPAVVDRIHPVLMSFCGRYHILGDVGAGQVAKTASNLIHWAEIVAIHEALWLARQHGVAPAALREALRHGGTDSRTLRELELMHFTWYAKDFAVARQLAERAGVPLPVSTLARELMDGITPESIRDLFAAPD
jgi:3-hydroxyisobutyrate dehydrogenase-like beta-hydroxyacid dehydrogenase